MRRANGAGSIFKVKGKLRNPWRARITVGWEVDELTGKTKQVVKTLGYFASRKDAEKAMSEYLDDPYNLNMQDMTFKQLYEAWSNDYFKALNSITSERTVVSAYRYMHLIYDVKVRDIRVRHLEGCIDDAYIISDRGKDKGEKRFASADTKSRMKSVMNLMFDFAVKYDVVKTNYARNFNLKKEIVAEKQRDKKEISIFTNEEIKLLWENVTKLPFADMVLIDIYSGWRPQELAILQIADIDLDNDIIKGGLKTDAGKDRIVPIHPLVKELVIKRYNEAVEMNSTYLFNDLDGHRGTVMTYDKYRRRFEKVMKRLNMTHRPHESRHTFSTLAKAYDMKDNVRKLIMGHAIIDFTDRVYTHPLLEELKFEMGKVGRLYPFGVTLEIEEDE